MDNTPFYRRTRLYEYGSCEYARRKSTANEFVRNKSLYTAKCTAYTRRAECTNDLFT